MGTKRLIRWVSEAQMLILMFVDNFYLIFILSKERKRAINVAHKEQKWFEFISDNVSCSLAGEDFNK